MLSIQLDFIGWTWDPPSKLPYMQSLEGKKAVPIEHGTACSGDPNLAALGAVVEREHERDDARQE